MKGKKSWSVAWSATSAQLQLMAVKRVTDGGWNATEGGSRETDRSWRAVGG